MAGRSEHDAVARGLPPETVAAGILVARIRLDLDKPDSKPPELGILVHEKLVQQLGR
jgi:hypothetical protein